MNRRALQAAASAGAGRRNGSVSTAGWSGWETIWTWSWRPGEWDHERWLFTGDLGSDRTAAWPCAHARLPGRHPLPSPPLRRLPPGQAGGRI